MVKKLHLALGLTGALLLCNLLSHTHIALIAVPRDHLWGPSLSLEDRSLTPSSSHAIEVALNGTQPSSPPPTSLFAAIDIEEEYDRDYHGDQSVQGAWLGADAVLGRRGGGSGGDAIRAGPYLEDAEEEEGEEEERRPDDDGLDASLMAAFSAFRAGGGSEEGGEGAEREGSGLSGHGETESEAMREWHRIRAGLSVGGHSGEQLPLASVRDQQTEWPLWWFAPFFDQTSFGKEAATLLLWALRSGYLNETTTWMGTVQEQCDYSWQQEGMPKEDFDKLDQAVHRADARQSAIVVCHSLPPFWARPVPKWESCLSCPPPRYTPAIAIGRAMAETDRYHKDFVQASNRMDEIWVPSRFSFDVMEKSGVDRSKLRILPIAVNTTLFDPLVVLPLHLPIGMLALGTARRFDFPPLVPSTVESKHTFSFLQDDDMEYVLGQWGSDSAEQGDLWDRYEGRQEGRGEEVLPKSPKSGEEGKKNNGTSASDSDMERNPSVLARIVVALSSPGQRPRSRRQDPLVTTRPAAVGAVGSGFSRKASRIHLTTKGLRGRRMKSGAKQAPLGLRQPRPFVFISVFKWEKRKGWDILLTAYLKEFSIEDDVELYILTKPFGDSQMDFTKGINRLITRELNMTEGQITSAPTVYVEHSHIDVDKYRRLLRSAQCFVLPSRGEGWGMPVAEAMSMGLPVIVTNWSGLADFVDASVGYPLKYRLSKVPDTEPWWLVGGQWANVDVDHLRSVMRGVYEEERRREVGKAGLREVTAQAKGAAARRLMMARYSPEAVAKVLAREVERIRVALRSGNCTSCHNSTWVASINETQSDQGGQLWEGDVVDDDGE